MRIIGLTGSIACGKSTVSAFLASRGFPVIDGDRISRELTSPGSPATQQIMNVFGPDVFYEDGTLNRRRLGNLIFSNPSARAELDNLMAPFLLDITRQRISEARSSGSGLCFLDMPLLFEKGYDRFCDTVWTVWLPEDMQIERLIARDGFTHEEAANRIHAVLSSDEKAARAGRVIDNSGPVSRTYAIVSELLSEELSGETRSSEACRQQPDTAGNPGAGSVLLQRYEAASAPSPMSRPVSASRVKNRKSGWRMPVWLKSLLISFTAFLLIGTTAFFLMNAYLRSCQQKHIDEQNEIDRRYPLLYRELIEKHANEYNLSSAFVSAVILNESSFQPRAESGVGARGLMQLMPDTAEWIAGKLKIQGYAFERMNDPESNIVFGCWYLNYLSKLFLGDPVAVTAAYHAGQGQVKIWLSNPSLSANGYSLPLELLPEGPTKIYTGRVLRDYGIYQEKYFSDNLLADPYDDSISGRLIIDSF